MGGSQEENPSRAQVAYMADLRWPGSLRPPQAPVLHLTGATEADCGVCRASQALSTLGLGADHFPSAGPGA